MKVLVTGGAGFIGSWLVEDLLKQGHSVIVIDNLSPQIHGAVPKLDISWLDGRSDVEFIRADIRDKSVIDTALAKVDAVVHLAAETGTGQSMYQIAHYYEVNQQATAYMLESIGTRHKNVRRVILASSRSIYGEGAYRLDGHIVVPQSRDGERMRSGLFEPIGPQGEILELVATPEDVTPNPSSIYAATKLANESMGRIFSEAYDVSVSALRFQNVYGERQSLKNPYTGILSIFSNRMRQGLPINIFEDGQESRDFVHVTDIVQAIVLSLESESRGYSVMNVGAGVATSVLDVATILRDQLGSSSELTITGDFRAGDIRHCYADLSRVKERLGYEVRVDINEGLRRFCQWVCTQPVMQDQSEKAMAELARLGLGKTANR